MHSRVPYKNRDKNYLITFDYNSPDEIQVTINDEVITGYSASDNVLILNDRPEQGDVIKITKLLKETKELVWSTFTPGTPVKAEDLNGNFDFLLDEIQRLKEMIDDKE